MVKLRFYGQARRLAGTDQLALQDAAGTSLREVLARFAGAAGGFSSAVVNNVLINGRNCMFLKGLETVVADGDVVDILPVVGGG